MMRIGAILRLRLSDYQDIDAARRMQALGLLHRRCCAECTFETVSPQVMLHHRRVCERFDSYTAAVLSGVVD